MTFINVSLGTPVVRTSETVTGDLGGLGARFIVDGQPSNGRFSLVEHPIEPRGLAAPMHLHTREDEYSFVLEGSWGFQLGEDIVYAGPGDLVYKPRDVWHTFWNASDRPARLLEIISPSGFEQFFVEMADALQRDPTDVEGLIRLTARYGLEMDFESVPSLIETHGLVAADLDRAFSDEDPSP